MIQRREIIALDPGNEFTAFVRYEIGHPSPLLEVGKLPNDELKQKLNDSSLGGDLLLIEMIASYGMAVGREVFDTCVWIGRFVEAWWIWDRTGHTREFEYFFRRDVKRLLCNATKANDANIRQALIDRFGPGESVAIGTKKAPGPLYRVKGDIWSALAIAVAYEIQEQEREDFAQRAAARESRQR